VSRPDLIGTVLAGRYKIKGVIGEGGMGSVYHGEQIAIDRRTAIKVLHADDDDDAAIARFRRGSRNAARIDHPNVCRIFEYGDPPGGLHFLAMEYIQGESIYDLMTKIGPIPLARAVRIMRQTVGALHAAHRLEIVHRDLKPGNIMLTRNALGEEGVKVVDFDIAKAPSDGMDAEITQLDWMVGTPLYMSPEQLRAEEVDHRSDIYSLGIVLYRMIAGTFPFSDATNPWTIIAERMASAPSPLSEAAPDLVFPPDLQAVFDRALQTDPDDRWPDVMAFGDALIEAVGPIADEEELLEPDLYADKSPETESPESELAETA
jgi:serine/threonine protein kinase